MNYKKKKRKKLLNYIILTFIFVLASLLIFINKDKFTSQKSILKNISLTIINIVTYPFDMLEEELKEKIETKNIREKYNELKNEIEQTEYIKNDYNELKFKINELEKAMNLKETYNNNIKIAKVINRNIGSWYDEITIDKGDKDGISIGDIVLVSDGLVGKIIKVTNNYSTVSLITSNKIDNISVKFIINDQYKYGILKNYENELFIVESFDNKIDILKDSIVTTTGITENYPSGIKIGIVNKIELDNFGLAERIYVKSQVDFDGLYYVGVIEVDK